MKNLMKRLITSISKLKETIHLWLLVSLFSRQLKTGKQPFLSIATPSSDLKKQELVSQEVQSQPSLSSVYAGLEHSEDIFKIKEAIERIVDDSYKRAKLITTASTMKEYKENGIALYDNRIKVQQLLERYIELERKNDYPINLKYRDWIRRVRKLK